LAESIPVKHAREDYARIQDPAGLIPADEPVFLLRGQDVSAPGVLEYWSSENLSNGGDPDLSRRARGHAEAMRDWQASHKAKPADGPVPHDLLPRPRGREPESARYVTAEPLPSGAKAVVRAGDGLLVLGRGEPRRPYRPGRTPFEASESFAARQTVWASADGTLWSTPGAARDRDLDAPRRPGPEQVAQYRASDDGMPEPARPAPGDGWTRDQPPPVPNDRPAVWDLVVEDMRARDAVGRARYGTPLQAFNGRDALADAYAEALDLVVYLRQAIAERDTLADEFDRLAGFLRDGDAGAGAKLDRALSLLPALAGLVRGGSRG
jgi:hypothetical protein